MLGFAKWVFVASAVSLVALQSAGQNQQNFDPQGGIRQGKDLLDLIGLGTGPDKDPYLARTNAACLNGDLAECFKSRALSSLEEFFDKPLYQLSENARILRMPTPQLRQLAQEPFEYSQSPRADEPEWDQLTKFAMRKVEKFLKSTAFEIQLDNEVTEHGRYSPRFIDEIADEIDIIEDKKDTLFKRKQLKKLFIPLLIILKLFKLKLLLFLPLILGLASFKKFLGFMAIIIPGVIGFFKLCKPNFGSTFGPHGGHYNAPHYSPAGVGYSPHYKDYSASEYSDNNYYGNSGHHGLSFRDDSHQAQDLAYSGYSQYRNAGGERSDVETSSKKSILPDS